MSPLQKTVGLFLNLEPTNQHIQQEMNTSAGKAETRLSSEYELSLVNDFFHMVY